MRFLFENAYFNGLLGQIFVSFSDWDGFNPQVVRRRVKGCQTHHIFSGNFLNRSL